MDRTTYVSLYLCIYISMGPYGVPGSLSMGPYGIPGSRDSWTRGLGTRGLGTRGLGTRDSWSRRPAGCAVKKSVKRKVRYHVVAGRRRLTRDFRNRRLTRDFGNRRLNRDFRIPDFCS